MRYRHFSVLSGKRLFGTLLVLFILPVALQSCGNLPWRRTAVIKDHIWLQGNNLSGLAAEEATVVITRLAEETRIAPVDAVIDPETDGVIPDLSGLEVDVDLTLERLLAARPGTEVEPVFIDVPAQEQLSSFPHHPLYQGNPQKSEVTFLINVAWGNEYLSEMLDVLQEAEVGATFFLVGRWVRANSEAACLISEAGFELANHGYSDAISMQQASFPQALEDIKHANDTIEEICGVRPIYFSPHKGELTDTVLRAAAEENCRTVMWTVDTVDWMLPGVETMLDRVVRSAEGGSLVLMHPTEQTAEFLRRVIPALRANGLEPVSLSRLLDPSRLEKGVTSP